MSWKTDLPPPPALAEALCDLLPALRAAAHRLAPRRDDAETLLFDTILEICIEPPALVPGLPLFDRLLSTMRTAHAARSRVADRCVARGFGPCPVEAERRGRADAILNLPAREREAVVILSLLRAPLPRAAELAGTDSASLIVRRASGEAKLADPTDSAGRRSPAARFA